MTGLLLPRKSMVHFGGGGEGITVETAAFGCGAVGRFWQKEGLKRKRYPLKELRTRNLWVCICKARRLQLISGGRGEKGEVRRYVEAVDA